MLVTGDFIGADEALAKGLVNRVVDAEQLDAEVGAAGREHRRQAARGASRMGKALFYRQLESRHRGGLRRRRRRRWPAT